MDRLFMTSYTVISALGRGVGATCQALYERRSGLRPCDFPDAPLPTYIGRVDGLEGSPIDGEFEPFDCRNNRLAWTGLKEDGFPHAVAEARKRYGAARVAVVMGTSTSGILETERAYRQRDSVTGALPSSFAATYRYTHNLFSLAHFVGRRLDLRGPALVISTACSSSAKAFTTAARLIRSGVCDAAVVGGVDSLCATTLYGFDSLGLMSSGPCRPSDGERDGLSIGEGGGFVLLEKRRPSLPKGSVELLGYGESSDGYHMSHPHPAGVGAILAMEAALRLAGLRPADIDYLKIHGTATKANDAIEDKAVTAVFGRQTPCSSTKGWTGHTLGAAGAVEAVIGALCIRSGLIPGTLNTEHVDPGFTSDVVLANRHQPVNRIMANFFGFGGNNCSLVIGLA